MLRHLNLFGLPFAEDPVHMEATARIRAILIHVVLGDIDPRPHRAGISHLGDFGPLGEEIPSRSGLGES